MALPEVPRRLRALGSIVESWLATLKATIDAIQPEPFTSDRETAVATGGQTVFDLSSITYTPGNNDLAVYINGVRQHPSAYTETDTNTVTFAAGLTAGAAVLFETYGTQTRLSSADYNTIYIRDNAVISATSGEGVKLDPDAPTWGWHDLLGDIIVRGSGAADPAYLTYRGNVRAYFFAVNDEVFLNFHVPHDYLPGSDIYIHAHWSQAAKTKAGAASGTVTGGSVTWGFEVTYAKGHQQAEFPATVNPTVAQSCSTTTFHHHIAEVQLSAATPSGTQIDSDSLEVDGIILVRVYLSANGITVSSGSVPAPVLHFVDIHYQTTNIGTKNKAPGFYV